MFFELRQYHIRPGQQEQWVKCMEEEIIPFQVKMGMVILGELRGRGGPVGLRLDPPLRERGGAQARSALDRIYQSDYWKNEISPRIGTMIDRRADQGDAPDGNAALADPVSLPPVGGVIA